MLENVRILIVEDEVRLAQEIRHKLIQLGYADVRIALSAMEAIEVMRERVADILIVDVYLDYDIDGVALMEILSVEYEVPFIFVTSYTKEEVVESVRSIHPCAYLLKPFNGVELKNALKLALINFVNHNNRVDRMVGGGMDLEYSDQILSIKDSLFVLQSDHFERIPFETIVWLEADTCSGIIQGEDSSYLITTKLNELEKVLPVGIFCRVHEHYVINKYKVTSLEGNFIFMNLDRIPVSEAYRNEVFGWLKTF